MNKHMFAKVITRFGLSGVQCRGNHAETFGYRYKQNGHHCPLAYRYTEALLNLMNRLGNEHT